MFSRRKALFRLILAAVPAVCFFLTLVVNGDEMDAYSGSSPETTLSPITANGLFDDWKGMHGIADAQGDAVSDHDIVEVKWYPDTFSSRLYMFCERHEGLTGKNQKAADWNFAVFFISAGETLKALVKYHPESEQVDVGLYDNNDKMIWRGKGKWGEDKYTARKVEFYVPLDHIAGDIETGFQTNIYIESGSDRAPDNGYITISTAGTFPWFTVLLALMWAALLLLLHKQRLHFYLFLAGSTGFFIFVMALGSGLGERLLEKAVAWGMWAVSNVTGSFSVLMANSMVTVTHGLQAVSFIIDYECSGFIEMLVYLSILLFYPLFGWRKKALYAFAGSLFIYASNLARLLLIGYCIKLFGTPVFFLSHTVFARILFFGLMVLLYYYVFTRMHIKKQRAGDLAYDR